MDELKKIDCLGLALQANVTDLDQVSQMFRKLMSEWSSIDILVNNAGILDLDEEFQRLKESVMLKAANEIKTSGKVQESMKVTSTFRDDWWHKIINVNLNSVFYSSNSRSRRENEIPLVSAHSHVCIIYTNQQACRAW